MHQSIINAITNAFIWSRSPYIYDLKRMRMLFIQQLYTSAQWQQHQQSSSPQELNSLLQFCKGHIHIILYTYAYIIVVYSLLDIMMKPKPCWSREKNPIEVVGVFLKSSFHRVKVLWSLWFLVLSDVMEWMPADTVQTNKLWWQTPRTQK